MKSSLVNAKGYCLLQSLAQLDGVTNVKFISTGKEGSIRLIFLSSSLARNMSWKNQ